MATASPLRVQTEFANVTRHWFGESGWVAPGNRFLNDSSGRLKSLGGAESLSGAAKRELINWAVAGVASHSVNAWTYFQQAVDALSTGSIELACHLAYYSELRAASSLLGRYGVFVMDGCSFTIDSAGDLHDLDKQPTHGAAWTFLKGWALLPGSATALASLVEVGTGSLEDWARGALGSSSDLLPVLLQMWSFDLDRLNKDKDWRNRVSYEPRVFGESRLRINARLVRQTLQEVWHLMEPRSGGKFAKFDQYLLRLCLHGAYRERYRTASIADDRFRTMVRPAATSFMKPSQVELMLDFLSPSGPGLPTLLSAARRSPRPQDPALLTAQGMLGRALTLLRLSTGALIDLKRKSGVMPDQLSSWVRDVWVGGQLGEPDGIPEDVLDAWIDIEDAIADLALMDETPSPFWDPTAGPRWMFDAAVLQRMGYVPVWGVAS